MAIGIILGIIFFVLIIAAFVAAWLFWENDNKKVQIISIVLAIVFIFSFLCVPFSFHTVDTGEVAVVKTLGKATNKRTAGTYFDFWMLKDYQKYDGKVRSIEINTAAYSSDAQTMTIDMDVQYQVNTEKVMDIATQYGTIDALESRITAISTERAKSTMGAHAAMHIIANRDAMSPAVEDAIRAAVGEEYYVNIVSVVVTNIDFSDAFELAVEEKMVAEQKQLKAQYENQTKIAQAEADAQAKLIAAQAESEANKLLEKSLTDKILQEMYLEKWDGKLPEVYAGDDSMSIMIPADSE